MNLPVGRLVPVSARPFNAETPLAALCQAITPVEQFFVRSNFDVPQLDARAWRLTCDGAVAVRRAFTLSELQRLPARSLAVTVECAGNGRTLMQPVPGGTPWQLGAVSTGVFRGVALRDVLAECGVHASAVELVFAGADSGVIDDGRYVQFQRSLPVARALHADTLLVWSLNDVPLLPEHGHPLRLLVPGYYGVASVKWLTRITAVDEPFTGHFQTERYIYRGDATYDDATPVTRMHVRALITEPASDIAIRGSVRVRGAAWSGFGAVTQVQLSVDGGSTWRDASLTTAASPYAAVLWEYEWTPAAAGEYELIARATDASGATQPLDALWNELGYGNNVVQRVRLRVV